jgi:hypothetical protein
MGGDGRAARAAGGAHQEHGGERDELLWMDSGLLLCVAAAAAAVVVIIILIVIVIGNCICDFDYYDSCCRCSWDGIVVLGTSSFSSLLEKELKRNA